jgi:hypothetical protein
MSTRWSLAFRTDTPNTITALNSITKFRHILRSVLHTERECGIARGAINTEGQTLSTGAYSAQEKQVEEISGVLSTTETAIGGYFLSTIWLD